MMPEPSVQPASARRASPAATAAAFMYGAALITLGVLAFLYVAAVSVVSVAVLGAVVAIGGIIEIVSALRAGAENRTLRLLSGALALAIGAVLFSRPAVGVAAGGFVLAAYLFASGLFRGVVSILDRPPDWAWDLLYAGISVFLGAYLLARWPASSFAVLDVVIAVELVSRGVAIIGSSLALRSASFRQARGGAAA